MATLKQYYLDGQAPPTVIYTQSPMKRKDGDFPEHASSLFATAPRVPPTWSLGSGLAPARAVSPLVRTGWRKMAGAPSRRRSLGTAD